MAVKVDKGGEFHWPGKVDFKEVWVPVKQSSKFATHADSEYFLRMSPEDFVKFYKENKDKDE